MEILQGDPKAAEEAAEIARARERRMADEAPKPTQEKLMRKKNIGLM